MPDFVQSAPDSTGKRIANITATLPAGTSVFNADGTMTTLTADAKVFLQAVVVADSKGNVFDSFVNEDTQTEMLQELKKIRRGIGKFVGDPFLDEE